VCVCFSLFVGTVTMSMSQSIDSLREEHEKKEKFARFEKEKKKREHEMRRIERNRKKVIEQQQQHDFQSIDSLSSSSYSNNCQPPSQMSKSPSIGSYDYLQTEEEKEINREMRNLLVEVFCDDQQLKSLSRLEVINEVEKEQSRRNFSSKSSKSKPSSINQIHPLNGRENLDQENEDFFEKDLELQMKNSTLLVEKQHLFLKSVKSNIQSIKLYFQSIDISEIGSCLLAIYLKYSTLASNFVNGPFFGKFIVVVILLAGVLVGIQSDGTLINSTSSQSQKTMIVTTLNVFDWVILGIFMLEVVLKIMSFGTTPILYFQKGWNQFDFLIVVASLIPGFK